MDYRQSTIFLFFSALIFLLGLALKVFFNTNSGFVSDICFLLSMIFFMFYTFRELLNKDIKNLKRLSLCINRSKILGLIGSVMGIILLRFYVFDQSASMYLIIGICVLVLLNSFFHIRPDESHLKEE